MLVKEMVPAAYLLPYFYSFIYFYFYRLCSSCLEHALT